MSRGLALGIDENLNIVCKGKDSHTDSGLDNGKYLKVELIIDTRTERGYVLEVDENTNDFWKMFQRKNGKLKKQVEEYIYKKIAEDETYYLKMLLHNMTYARGENQDASRWEAERDQHARGWKAGRNQHARGWKAGRNQDACGWEAGQDQYASRWEAERDQYARWWKAERDQHARGWEAERDQDAGYWDAGQNQYANGWGARKDQYATGWEAGETQDFSFCVAKRRIVSYQKTQNNENNEFIKMLSDKAKNNELDWDYIVELARKGYYDDEQ